jgi:hypothetical protein
MKQLGCTILAVLALILTYNFVHAATLNVPAQYNTVQAAVDAAQAGDTVLIAAGTYSENVSTVRVGSSDSRIVIDGQNVATINRFYFNHAYITVQNLTITGESAAYSRLVWFARNADYGILSNCVLDVAENDSVYAIQWNSPTVKPIGTDAASNCQIINCEITGVVGSSGVTMYGSNNRVENCNFHDFGSADFIRLWGQDNYIGNNTFDTITVVEGIGYHIDFIQTFGDNGFGSLDHIIENNIIKNVEGGQFSQLSDDGVSEMGNWQFRNNIVYEVDLQASLGIPNLRFYNNIFYRCNKVNEGHVLYFNRNGGKAYNNVFLDCGGDDQMNKGWYQFTAGLTDVAADYNYTAKAGYVAVTEDSNQIPIGTEGWDNFGWWENNGINGGNPGFVNELIYDFKLVLGSILIDVGTDLSAFFTKDFDGNTRETWDIGAYEFQGVTLNGVSFSKFVN